MTSILLPNLSSDQVRSACSMREAIDALQKVILAGTAGTAERTTVSLTHGELLLMPAEIGDFVGCKVASVAPDNPKLGLERIQALYLLLDSATLTPIATMDGTELTAIRTPAVSAAVVDLVTPSNASSLAVFGTGPQAERHIEAMRAIRPLTDVRVVATSQAKAQAFAERLSTHGLPVRATTTSEAVQADIVVAATTASEALWDDEPTRASSTFVAVGSHHADKRELAGPLFRGAQVIVESMHTATTEAGDIIRAVSEGFTSFESLIEFAALSSTTINFEAPRIIKTCGMGWQDLAVAAVAYRNRLR